MRFLFTCLTFLYLTYAGFSQNLNSLEIKTQAGKTHIFSVELASSPENKARGLMFRMKLDEDKGMLFDFGPGQIIASMWMKNTFIPLDMLFIKEDGVIESIAQNTTPHSIETVSSKSPVRLVLELAGGVTQKLEIKAGDKIFHTWLKK